MQKTAVDKEWKKLETIPAGRLEEVKSKEEVVLEAQRDKNCNIKGHTSPQESGFGTEITEVQRQSRAPW